MALAEYPSMKTPLATARTTAVDAATRRIIPVARSGTIQAGHANAEISATAPRGSSAAHFAIPCAIVSDISLSQRFVRLSTAAVAQLDSAALAGAGFSACEYPVSGGGATAADFAVNEPPAASLLARGLPPRLLRLEGVALPLPELRVHRAGGPIPAPLAAVLDCARRLGAFGLILDECVLMSEVEGSSDRFLQHLHRALLDWRFAAESADVPILLDLPTSFAAHGPGAVADFVDEVNSPAVGVYLRVAANPESDSVKEWFETLAYRVLACACPDRNPRAVRESAVAAGCRDWWIWCGGGWPTG